MVIFLESVLVEISLYGTSAPSIKMINLSSWSSIFFASIDSRGSFNVIAPSSPVSKITIKAKISESTIIFFTVAPLTV